MNQLKFFIVVILLGCVVILQAQPTKGRVLTGVSTNFVLNGVAGTGNDIMGVGFSSIKLKSDAPGADDIDGGSFTSFNISPKFGILLIDNLALGVDVTLGHSSEKDDFSKWKNTMFTAGPFIRYYIVTESVWPYVEVNSSFGSYKSRYEDTDTPTQPSDEYKQSITSFGGGIGLAAPLGEHVTFDILLGYNSMTLKDAEDNPDNDRYVIGTLGLKLGFVIFLGNPGTSG